MPPSRPVFDTLEMLGKRWSLRLVWELRRDAIGFAELRSRTGISSSVLAQRLRDLAAGGVVERDESRRYRLSSAGRELARVLFELNRWAEAAAHEARQGQAAILGA